MDGYGMPVSVGGCALYGGLANADRVESELEDLANGTNVSSTSSSSSMVIPKVTIEPSSMTPTEDPDANMTPMEKDIRFLEEQEIPIPEKEVDFAGLQENTNKDIYAWIYVPDTQVDYPVLQQPTDNTHYINYNIDGSKG